MLMTRANLNGGRRLHGFPLQEENGSLGYKLGYCSHCNEPILVRTIEAGEIMAHFKIGEGEYKNLLKKLRPKLHWRDYVIKWLGGNVASVHNF